MTSIFIRRVSDKVDDHEDRNGPTANSSGRSHVTVEHMGPPATSLQRLLPEDRHGQEDLTHLGSGELTDDLFLALRNKKEIAIHKMKRRLSGWKKFSGIFPLTAQHNAEVDELRRFSGSKSSTSTISLEELVELSPDSRSPVTTTIYTNHPSKPTDCGLDCWLQDHPPTITSGDPSSIPDSILKESISRLIYPALEYAQTRILCLHPGMVTEHIGCELLPMNIENVSGDQKGQIFSGEYEALSYCWGSSDRNCMITCNLASCFVTRSLYLALQNLRLPDRPRYIWVDALCINQDDIHERNAQIQYMMLIYRQAQRVIVWVGVAAKDSSLAIAAMNYFDNRRNRQSILWLRHNSKCLKQLTSIYNSLLEFYRRPYFRRTWIRQEIGVARSLIVRCGQSVVAWNVMKRTAKRLNSIREKLEAEGVTLPAFTIEDSVGPLRYFKKSWVYGESVLQMMSEKGSLYYFHGGGLLDLLLAGREYNSTDPRDRVYAVLGLAREPTENGTTPLLKPSISKGIKDHEAATAPISQLTSLDETSKMVVNYNESISEVYQRLAKHFINRDQNLDILCVLSDSRDSNSNLDLPSWVPDWRILASDIGAIKCMDYLLTKLFASGYTRSEPQDQSDINRLCVRGYFIDVITFLRPVTTGISRMLGVSGRTLYHDLKTRERLRIYDSSQHIRRCAYTRNGHHVLVPSAARIGDSIFVLLGARLPFVLRSLESNEHIANTELEMEAVRTVVGPCCVPGFMQGEVFSTLEKGVKPVKMILI